uniref:Mitochondrial translational initiation factor 3 n=1 Tax=Amphiprion percula TaxID=161767 RepID=A0A3P8SAM7_AMPPE
MSAGCVRFVLSHAVRTMCIGSPIYWTSASRFTICRVRYNIAAPSWRWPQFSTEGHGAEETAEETPAPKKKKKDPGARNSISSVGRKIPYRQIQVISEAGENLGTMHRADVIRMMDEEGLKLVLLSENKDPPVYRLMSGKQIHEEQMTLREKKKAKAAPVQVKELTFSCGIASHDLSTKLKQAESWLEKKHHVKITLRSGRAPAVNLDTTLEEMVKQMEVIVGFVAKPKVVRDGRAATCILRPPSAKELKEKNKVSEPQSVSSTSKASQSKTSAVTSTETTEGSIQQ